MAEPNTTTEELPRPRRRRLFIGLLVAVILAVIAIPVYRSAKTWRAQHLAQEALAAADKGDWNTALTLARTANGLGLMDLETQRRIVALQRRVATTPALAMMARLVELPGATDQDRRDYASLALEVGSRDTAWRISRELLKKAPENTANLVLALDVSLALKRRDEAKELLHKMLTKHPGDRASQLKQGRLLLGEEANQDIARALLWEVARENDALALEAMEALAFVTKQPAQRSDLAQRVRSHPQAELMHHVMALELEAPADPDARVAFFLQGLKAFATEPKQRDELVRLLVARKHPRVALELAAADEAPNQATLLARLDALARIGRWENIRETLNAPMLPLPDSVKQVFLARCAMELGEGELAQVHWTRARLAAGRSLKDLTYVAEYAERIGQMEAVRKVFETMARNPSQARIGYAQLVRLAEAAGDTERLVKLYEQMNREFPRDDTVGNDLLYLHLLQDTAGADAVEQAALRLQNQPRVMAYRATLALAHLRAGEPQAGLALYQPVVGRLNDFAPGWQAVYAGLLYAAGQKKEAKTIAQKIDPERLKSEEKKLFETNP